MTTRSPILIVEDNEINLFILQAMLRKHGRQALVARDGDEGVEMAAANRPRLVLMDLGMPRMNGLDAAVEIRRRLPDMDIAIVAVTADVTDERRRACQKAGFDDLLTKPVDFQELLAIVDRWTSEDESGR